MKENKIRIKEIQEKLNSNTFCILPWIHLSTRPGGVVRVCCTANASSVGPTNDKKYGGMVGVLKSQEGKPVNLNDNTFLDVWNGQYMKNIRLKMLNGEEPPSCIKCYKEEKSGFSSKRIWETEYWFNKIGEKAFEIIKKTKEDGSIEPKLIYLDLRFGNKCNLSCIMCSPHDSSLWIPLWNEYYDKIKNKALKETSQWKKEDNPDGKYNWYKNNQSFWDELYNQIPNMKQLYFAGGESTIIEEHYSLLEKIVDMGYSKNIELRYNSNGIELPKKLFDLWSKFQKVKFHFSIDSIYSWNDYIRYPSKWETIEQNLNLLDNLSDNIEITIASALQVLNIYYIPEFIKWKLNKKYKKINIWPSGAGLINFHIVYHPPHLNIKILPKEFKKKISEKYENFFIWLENNWELSGAPTKEDFLKSTYGIKRMKGFLNFMNSEDWSSRMEEFKEYINLMDKIRKTDFKKTFPEMKELLD